jgi:hypothetical protein
MGGKIVCDGGATFPAGSYKQVSVGEDGTDCAIHVNGKGVCLMGGTLSHPSGSFTQLSAGEEYACGVASGGGISCWGSYPKPTPSGTFKAVSVGGGLVSGTYACGLRPKGRIVCWGGYPRPVPTTSGFTEVSAGADSACGLTSSQGVRCWGGLDFVLP